MKKIILYSSVLAICLALVSCNKGNTNQTEDKIAYTTNLIIEGLLGELTATFTDGGTTQFVVNEDGTAAVKYESVSEDLVIYSLSSETIGEVLIGRKANETIALKFADDILVLRDAVEGVIPIGAYAEFALISYGESSAGISYAQEADLDMLGSEELETAGLTRQSWTPIGYYSISNGWAVEDNSFRGHFNGKGFTLSNLYINCETEGRSSGLFGYIDWDGSLKDIHIISGSVTGTQWVGAICGLNYFGCVILNCSNAADVTGIGGDFNSYVGGVGGICGNNDSATILACSNSGNIKATGQYNGTNSLSGSHVGGIAGYNAQYSMTGIQSCYNTGNISGSECVGGITGDNENVVKYCYNTGKVSATGNGFNIGGIAGISIKPIEACYWLQYSDGVQYGIGGTVPLGNYDQMVATPTNDNANAFSSITWATSEAGWVIGNGTADNYWKSLGSWVEGGTPNGINSTFPILWWE